MLASSGRIERPAPFNPPENECGVGYRQCLTGVSFSARPARRCRPPRRSRPTIPGVRALSTLSAPFRAKMDVPSTPAGIPVGCAPCGLSRSSAWCRLRCRAPHRGARSRRQSPWTRTRTSGRTRAGISRWPLAPGESARGAGWMASLRRALARAPGGAREGASESAQMVLSVVVVGKPRCSSIAVSARERLRRKSPVSDSNVK